MRLYEYSGLTAEIPADIFDSIVAIERLRALDPIRVREYSAAIPVAEGMILEGSPQAVRGLFQSPPSFMDASRAMGGDPDASELEQLDASYNMADGADVNPLLLVPAAVFDLCMLSGTDPGASFPMTQALLAAHGFPALRCMDLASHADGEDLEEAIADSSDAWDIGGNDPFPFIRCVCAAVLECESRFDTAYPLDMGRKLDKSTRILNIIRSSREPVSKAEICAMAPDISRRTADGVIAELVDANLVEKGGSFKDARYSAVRRTLSAFLLLILKHPTATVIGSSIAEDSAAIGRVIRWMGIITGRGLPSG